MPDPVRAWAAVAPDGTLRSDTSRPTEDHAWDILCLALGAGSRGLDVARADAYRAGWRVVEVEIKVKDN